jgi:hypothetical protein
VDPGVTKLIDSGDIEKVPTDILDNTVAVLAKLIEG